jgi:gamma-glutamyltranspeptidase/glutathione hydrolase
MKTPRLNAKVIVMTVLVAALCFAQAPAPVKPATSPLSFEHGAVVSVEPIASNVGMEILKKGGNAVDGAVATGLALAVTHPTAGNLGGGGFMLIYLADKGGQLTGIDFREKAPEKSTPTMFLTNGEVDQKKSDVGALTIGVPGSVRGFYEASKRYGKLDWKAVVEPALKLARDGFVVDEVLARSLKGQERVMGEFTEFGRVYRKADGKFYEAGETIKLPDLAWTLQQIYNGGADGFYKGEVAKRLVAGVQAGGGIITLNDLANYDAKVRTPVRGTYRGFEVVGMPPSSSGGTTVIQMLNVLEGYDLGELKRRDPKAIHLLTESMRIGFYNRAKYLGDTDFVKVDLAKLTSKEFIKPFREKISMDHAMKSSALGADIITRGEGSETTHFSVVDANGNAVSNTFTLEQGYGSRVVAPGTGFLLNNEMHDFNMNPGVTDTKGLIGTPPNLIAPGKRMLSSMSPMIILKDGKPYLVTGSPGGRTIPNTVLQVIVNVIDFKMDAQAAVDEPRVHHQWMPDTLTLERALGEIQPAMEKLGHTIRVGGTQGDAQSILIKDGKKYPGVDHRTRGGAAGY